MNTQTTTTAPNSTTPTSRSLGLLFLLLAFCAVAVSACSTARGVGRDARHVGRHIEHAVR